VASFREVINSPRFEAELEAIESDPRLADQVLHALSWALARKPEKGFPVPGTNFSIWPVYIRQREHVVYYHYGSTWVELLSIVLSDSEVSP
jgi:hypothetical protein